MSDLTPRQQTILGLVIREYVASTHPISSKMLLEHYDMGVAQPPCATRCHCLKSWAI
jgi:transcriptional regulator of heat shock response